MVAPPFDVHVNAEREAQCTDDPGEMYQIRREFDFMGGFQAKIAEIFAPPARNLFIQMLYVARMTITHRRVRYIIVHRLGI